MSAYRLHKIFCIHTYSARPVKQVALRSEVAAGMCVVYIFVMPRKNGHNMRNVCGRGAGSTVDFIRDKTFFASYIRYRIQEFRQFEEK